MTRDENARTRRSFGLGTILCLGIAALVCLASAAFAVEHVASPSIRAASGISGAQDQTPDLRSTQAQTPDLRSTQARADARGGTAATSCATISSDSVFTSAAGSWTCSTDLPSEHVTDALDTWCSAAGGVLTTQPDPDRSGFTLLTCTTSA